MTLPTFIVGGAPKSGTTSLHRYLDAHPDVFMCPVKEPDFFHDHWDRGVEWYASLYDGVADETAIGEASPGTLASAEAAERIHGLVPDMRFVFVLRDPVERAHSQHLFGVARGISPASVRFGDLIRDEADPWRQRVVELGMYGEQIERYARLFGRDQLHVLLFDDLKADRDRAVREILEFVGVDAGALKPAAADETHNATAYPRHEGVYRAVRAVWDPVRRRLGPGLADALYPIRSAIRGRMFTTARDAKPELADADREYLAGLYEDSNARLAAWLGRDLGHWASPSRT